MPKLVLAAVALFVALAAGGAPAAAAHPHIYEEGQVWEYRTRAQDAGSLLRIQRIAPDPHGGPTTVYHISLVGLRFAGSAESAPIGHLPVSREALDASVLRLSDAQPVFPDAEEGIAIWTAAEHAGVFDIPIAQIVDVAEAGLREAPQEQPVTAAGQPQARSSPEGARR